MISKEYFIFDEDKKANLVSYIRYNSAELQNPPRPSVIVCPGGGYGFLSDREAEPIVVEFLAKGFNCFVLNYSLNEMASDYRPAIEVAKAVKFVRDNAVEFNVDKEKVFTCGFSAGGHIALSAGTLFNAKAVKDAMGNVDEELYIPNGMILAYPVVTCDKQFTHEGTAQNVCGSKTPSYELRDEFSLEKHVSAKTPRAYVWHTYEDTCVPVENSILLFNAMRKANINVSLHIYPHGPHGLALASKETDSCWNCPRFEDVKKWVDEATYWALNS